ncbi:EscU/YscU/HrcU family type III secretion system export apparatus switch protein [Algirhabdus cladophorae]|uniref:EscU/YscU/HrcU family type III secretion system export apparatus switch protein n=1 Tax=Algirhabdus cladophorae TaxID=3377108 RepID=UPI003B849DC0
MSEDTGEEKQHEATEKKLQDARKKGDLAKSVDLTTAAAYGGFLLAFYGFGSGLMAVFGSDLMHFIAEPSTLARNVFSDQGPVIIGALNVSLIKTLGPWFLLPAVLALSSILAQQSFVVVVSNLAPKISRISPLSNVKNKFGRKGLFEFAKSFVKLCFSGSIAFWFLADRFSEIVLTMQQGSHQVALQMVLLLGQFMVIMFLFTLLIGSLDFFWQRQEFLRKNRMSHQELKDEAKSSEGDPHHKQQRRQRGYEIATSQMLTDVEKADVVVVNPTHYAVALKWDRDHPGAPICVGKGVDEIAARIRECAQENAIPIHSDPPTARALHATLEIGDEVPPEFYAAVAAAIKFAEKMNLKAKGKI